MAQPMILSVEQHQKLSFTQTSLCTTQENNDIIHPFSQSPCEFQEMTSDKDFARGLSKNITWIKFTLNNNTNDAIYRWMSIGFSRLEHIHVWSSDMIEPIKIGAYYPINQREIENGQPTIKVNLKPNESKTYIIAFKSQTFIDTSIDIWTPENYLLGLGVINFYESIALGGLLLSAVFSFFIFFIIKDKSFIYFGLAIIGSFFYAFQQSGLMFNYFWPTNLPYYTPLLSICSGASMIFFTLFINHVIKNFSSEFSWIVRVITIITSINVFAILYGIVFDYQVGVKIWTPGIFLLLITGTIALFWAWTKGSKAAGLIVLSFFFVLILEGIKLGFIFGGFQFSHIQSMLGSWATILTTPLILLGIAFQTQELRQKLIESETLIATKSKFIQIINHEIRSPLNRIINMSQSISQKPIKNQITHQCQHILAIIDDALKNQTIFIVNKNINLNPVLWQSFIKQVTYNISYTIKNVYQFNHNNFEIIDKTSLNRLLIDEYRLLQVIDNLVENASKYCIKSEIKIVFEVIDHKNNIVELIIHIIDTGEGIHEQEQHVVFEPFIRGTKHTSSDIKGNGMGLAIVRQLLDQMNIFNAHETSVFTNKINLKSSKKGSHFTVHLYTYLHQQTHAIALDESKKNSDLLSDNDRHHLLTMVKEGDISEIINWANTINDKNPNMLEFSDMIKACAIRADFNGLTNLLINKK